MIVTAFLISAIALFNNCYHQQPICATLMMDRGLKKTGQDDNSQQKAKRIWEEALAAKGGRERLYAVRNMVISSRGLYLSSGRRKNPIEQEELLVFPNKYWFWNDLRPDLFGLSVEMFNLDSNMHYIVSPDNPNSQPKPIIPNKQVDELFLYAQLLYLLETKWFKPILVTASTEKIGHREADVVETKVRDRRVDFAFDRESHLLIQARIYRIRNNKEVLDDVINLLDYREVSGIKVPQTIKYDDGTEYKKIFQFNVEYDESIFVKPPPIEAGPEAWRPKIKK